MRAIHEFEPVFNSKSKILVLGSFPSVKSREQKFYYGHPQNRFWKMMAFIMSIDTPVTIEEKKSFLLNHQIALWDVIDSCEIVGSSDSSIKDVVPNPINDLIDRTSIKAIFCNGKTSYNLLNKYFSNLDIPIYCMPSTSPANAIYTFDKLVSEWVKIKEYL